MHVCVWVTLLRTGITPFAVLVLSIFSLFLLFFVYQTHMKMYCQWKTWQTHKLCLDCVIIRIFCSYGWSLINVVVNDKLLNSGFEHEPLAARSFQQALLCARHSIQTLFTSNRTPESVQSIHNLLIMYVINLRISSNDNVIFQCF